MFYGVDAGKLDPIVREEAVMEADFNGLSPDFESNNRYFWRKADEFWKLKAALVGSGDSLVETRGMEEILLSIGLHRGRYVVTEDSGGWIILLNRKV